MLSEEGEKPEEQRIGTFYGLGCRLPLYMRLLLQVSREKTIQRKITDATSLLRNHITYQNFGSAIQNKHRPVGRGRAISLEHSYVSD